MREQNKRSSWGGHELGAFEKLKKGTGLEQQNQGKGAQAEVGERVGPCRV